MHQIQVDDRIYQQAMQCAADEGFASVDEYIADVLQGLFQAETEDLNYLFTPERLAAIDRAAAQIDAGQFFTREQADIELAKRRNEWLRQNPDAT